MVEFGGHYPYHNLCHICEDIEQICIRVDDCEPVIIPLWIVFPLTFQRLECSQHYLEPGVDKNIGHQEVEEMLDLENVAHRQVFVSADYIHDYLAISYLIHLF